MLRGLRRRLDRLWEPYRRAKEANAAEHNSRTTLERFVLTVRAGLVRAGVDPKSVPAMRQYEPGGFLHDVVGIGAPPRQPPPEPETPVERLRAKLLRILDHHRDRPIDLDRATPMELFALYCFVPDAPGVGYIGPEAM